MTVFRGTSLALVLLAGTRTASAQVAAAASHLATVSVQTARLGTAIARDFIGFSLEVSTAGQGIGAFASDTVPGGPRAVPP